MRDALAIYLKRTNYVYKWKRSGFDDSDVAAPGIDALAAHGRTAAVAAKLKNISPPARPTYPCKS